MEGNEYLTMLFCLGVMLGAFATLLITEYKDKGGD